MTERLAVRGLLGKAGVRYAVEQEAAAISGLLQHAGELAHNAGGAAPLPAPPSIEHVDSLAALPGNEQFRAVAAAALKLEHDLSEWAQAGERRAGREAAWAKLGRLLAHADGIDAAGDVSTQRDAILASRLLLAVPDPIAPLITQLGDALRAAVAAAVQEAQSAHATAIDGLEQSAEWQQLDAAAREPFLADAELWPIAAPAVASSDDLLATLDSVSLASWRERRQALPAKAAAARAAAAKSLEPKSVEVRPPSATLKTPDDVDAYLTQLREILMSHIPGETVIL